MWPISASLLLVSLLAILVNSVFSKDQVLDISGLPDKHTIIHGKQAEFKINPTDNYKNKKYFFIVAEADGFIEIIDGASTSKKVSCIGYNRIMCLGNFSTILEQTKKATGYRIKVRTPDTRVKEIFVQAGAVDVVPMMENSPTQITLRDGLNKFESSVDIKDAKNIKKFRFQLTGNSRKSFDLKAFGNYAKKETPTAEKHDFEFRRVESHTLAYLADSSDQQVFCSQANCSYSFLIEGKELKGVTFKVTLSPELEEVENDVKYYDYLKPRESRSYRFFLPSDLSKSSLKISLQSVMGHANLYANPISAPSIDSQNTWQVTSGVSKNIIIPAQERKSRYNDFQTLYVKVSAEVESAYFLIVTSFSDKADDPEVLYDGSSENGFSPFEKIKNYDITVKRTVKKGDEAEKSQISISLNTHGHLIDLYAYQRTPKFSQYITQDMLVVKNNPEEMHFHSVLGPRDRKTLNLEIECTSKTAIMTVPLSDDYESYICSVAVGVLPRKPFGGKDNRGAGFEIGYTQSGVHNILHLYHHKDYDKLQPGESRLMMLNLHTKTDEAIKAVQLLADLRFGQVSLTISKTNVDPCSVSSEGDIKTTLVNSRSRTIQMSTDDNLFGNYYICLKNGDSLSSVRLLPKTTHKKDSGAENDRSIHHLPSGESVFVSLENQYAHVYFRFEVDLEDQPSETSISINLSPIRGGANYIIVVSSSDSLPSPAQTFWKSSSNSLSLSPDDPLFKRKGTYTVGIFAPQGTNQHITYAEHQFMLSYALSSQHVLMKPGLYYRGVLERDGIGKEDLKTRYLEVEVPPKSQNLTILKEEDGFFANIFGSFAANNTKPTQSEHCFSFVNNVKGVFFSGEDLKKKCPNIDTSPCYVYLTVSRTFNIQTSFGVAYSVGDTPFILHPDIESAMPSIYSNEVTLNLGYHLPNDNIETINMDLSIQNQHAPYSSELIFLQSEETTASNQPLKRVWLKGAQQEYSISLDEYKENEFLHIKLRADQDSLKKNPFNYPNGLSFYLTGSVEVTNQFKNLRRGHKVIKNVEEKTWTYFKFFHNSQQAITLNLENLQGVCWMYLSKGLEHKPSFAYNLASSAGSEDQDIVFKPEDNHRQNHNFEGEYAVGVYCYQGGRFGITYNAENSRFTDIPMGITSYVNVRPGREQYIRFKNFGELGEIKVSFKTTKALVKFYVLFHEATAPIKEEDSKLPTEENYSLFRKQKARGHSGFFNLTNGNEAYCINCEYVLLVQTDIEDKLEIEVRKTNSFWSFSYIEEGKEKLSSLRKGENETFTYFTKDTYPKINLEIEVFKGSVEIEYSISPLFLKNETLKYKADHKNPMNSIALKHQGMKNWPTNEFHWVHRFIRVRGTGDVNEFSLMTLQSKRLFEFNPMKTYQRFLGNSGEQLMYLKTAVNQSLEFNFRIKKIFTDTAYDYERAFKKLTEFVTFYQCNALLDVFFGNCKTPVARDQIEMNVFNHALYANLIAPSKFLLVELKNPFSFMLGMNMEVYKDENRILRPKHLVAGILTDEQPALVYKTDIYREGLVAKMDLLNCFKEIEAWYVFTPYSTNKPQNKVLLRNTEILNNAATFGEAGELAITVSKPASELKRIEKAKKEGPKKLKLDLDDGSVFTRPLQGMDMDVFDRIDKASTTFTLDFSLKTDSNNLVDLVDPRAISVQDIFRTMYVEPWNGNLRFPKPTINLQYIDLNQYNLLFNYTVIFSEDAMMLEDVCVCHTFYDYMVSQALEGASTRTFSTSFLVNDHIYERMRRNKKPENFLMRFFDYDNFVRIEPGMFVLDRTLKASLVIEATILPRDGALTDVKDFDKFVYRMGEFQYGGSLIDYVKVAVGVLLVLTLAWCILLRYGVYLPLKWKGYLDAFRTDAVENEIVLEVKEYRTGRRVGSSQTQERELNETVSSITSESDQDKSTANIYKE